MLLVRLRFVDGVAWSVHKAVLPVGIANKLVALRSENIEMLCAPDFSLYRAYVKAGMSVDHAEEVLRTRTATTEEARLLKLRRHAPLMTLLRKSYDARNTLLEIVESDYAGGNYSYAVNLAVSYTTASATSKSKRLGWKVVND